ncbi:hypothetical protein GGF46_004031 [Coemansia sp. RSA 552]|nr:hypothetical protein GGF46_004031 [Coemansia sp. RSA 552]
MAYLSYSWRRVAVALLAVGGIVLTSLILLRDMHDTMHDLVFEPLPVSVGPGELEQLVDRPDVLLNKLAVLLPINGNTDMRFYRNTWLRKYLYPVCDWPGKDCRIVCNRTSTYKTIDRKTICMAREAQKIAPSKEFFIKLDDDAFVDRDYIVRVISKFLGRQNPVYISDFILNWDKSNQGPLNKVWYGNGKFYMFNRPLLDCLNTDIQYQGRRAEDAVFGGMVSTGCGEANVTYVKEDDNWIWHRTYESLNKFIDLAHIKNH